jgi:hypothetical protein
MVKYGNALLIATMLLAGCKGRTGTLGSPSGLKSTPARDPVSLQSSAPPQDSFLPQGSVPSQSTDPTSVARSPQDVDAQTASINPQYSDPPTVDVGLGVEQAYAAIPHRRTIWVESDTTVPAEEKDYLNVMFQVLDQAVAVRVAGLQNFSSGKFDSVNIDGEFDRLITFVRAMPVPKTLTSYHKDILDGLSDERQFFAEWKSQRDGFEFAKQIGNHPGVRAASAALKTAYSELMTKYPNESQANKDAFYDYHCALDFL